MNLVKNIHLTDDEKRILDGRQGYLAARCMEFLVAYGEAAGAECLVDIDGTVDIHPGSNPCWVDGYRISNEEIAQAARRAALPDLEIEPQLEEKVDFDTFCKSDFRAVKVKDCQKVKKSDKLLRFTLDDGTGTDRQILSGIAKWYAPEDLMGKTLVAVVNLPPRKMMGLESCGMLISAVHTEHGEERLNLLMVDDRIPAGAKLC